MQRNRKRLQHHHRAQEPQQQPLNRAEPRWPQPTGIPGPCGPQPTGIPGPEGRDQRSLERAVSDLSAIMQSMSDRIGRLEPPADSARTAPQPLPVVTPMVTEDLGGRIRGLEATVQALGSNDLRREIEQLQERLRTVEQRAQLPATVSQVRQRSIGHTLLESEAAKRWKAREYRHSDRVQIPSLIFQDAGRRETIISTTEMGDASIPYYRPGIAADRLNIARLVELIPRIIAPGIASYVIRKETEASLYGHVTTVLDEAIDGDPTPKTTATFTSTDGFVADSWVRFHLSGGTERRKIVSINTTTNVVTFAADDLDFDAPDLTRVTAEVVGATAESATKPYGYGQVSATTVSIKTIAVLLGLTEQVLNTVPGINAWLDAKMRPKTLRMLSHHLLYGDASVANEIDGYSTQTGAQTYAWSDGETGDNRFDALVRSALYIPDGAGAVSFILNRFDWGKLLLLKGTDGHYINGAFGRWPVTMVNGLWYAGPFPMITDAFCEEGDFFAVDLMSASELVDAGNESMSFGYVNDQFATNEITARHEMHLLHAIISLASYVLGTWDAAPS